MLEIVIYLPTPGKQITSMEERAGEGLTFKKTIALSVLNLTPSQLTIHRLSGLLVG